MKQCLPKYKHKTDGSDRIIPFSYFHLRCQTTPVKRSTQMIQLFPIEFYSEDSGLYIIGVFIGLGILI